MTSLASQAAPRGARVAPAPTGRRGWAPLLVLGVLTVAGFALRFAAFRESIWGDEWLTLLDVREQTLSGVVHAVAHGAENSPPLYFVLAWLSAKLGDPDVLIRLPSLVLGVATIPLVYVLGLRTVGRRAALAGA